jgi:hypothetical protein
MRSSGNRRKLVARTAINSWCNIVTGDHSNAYRSPSPGRAVRPQITVPRLRLRLDIRDAKALGAALLEAADIAEEQLKVEGQSGGPKWRA